MVFNFCKYYIFLFLLIGIEILFKFLNNLTIDKSFNGMDGVEKVRSNYENP